MREQGTGSREQGWGAGSGELLLNSNAIWAGWRVLGGYNGWMQQNSGGMPFGLSGRWQYRLRSVLALYRALIAVSARRLVRGPRRDNWTWGLEVSLDFMRAQARAAFAMPDMARAREYEDALVFASPAAARVRAEPVEGPPRGCWVHPPSPEPDRTVLYLHGGGFAY